MSYWRPRAATAVTISAWILSLVLSPIIVLIGEPARRLVLRRLRRSSPHAPGCAIPSADQAKCDQMLTFSYHTGWRPSAILLHSLVFNPISIALTAPGRWVIDWLLRFGHLARARRGRGGRGSGPPYGGVREPRRPKPSPPVDAVALPEPR